MVGFKGVKALLAGILLMSTVPSDATSEPRPVLPSVDAEAFANRPLALADGTVGEPVSFSSANPVDYGPLLRGDLGTKVQLNAQLFRPAGTRRPLPAIVMVPGSGGIGTHHLVQAAALTSAGFAVLLIDPFRGRGIGDTVADQGRLSWAASSYDVIAATRFLRSQVGIDKGRIGALGSSRGGTAVMMAAMRPLSDVLLGPQQGLRAVVAGYPWCGTQFRNARLARGASLLLLSGDRDDWVSLQQCQDAVHALTAAGDEAAIMIFPGARHAFDRADVPPTRLPQAPTSTTYPTVYMDEAGRYFNLRSGLVDPALTSADFVRASIAGGFVHTGVTIGSEGTQAADYVTEMVRFFRSQLLRPDPK